MNRVTTVVGSAVLAALAACRSAPSAPPCDRLSCRPRARSVGTFTHSTRLDRLPHDSPNSFHCKTLDPGPGVPPRPGTELTIDLAHSSFSIPIVGGINALNKAGAR